MLLVKLCGEHTIDLDLLPKEPLVLDVGCRYFNFCEEILGFRPKARIIALDPATDVEKPSDPRIEFYNHALVVSGNAWMKPNDWVVKQSAQEGSLEIGVISMSALRERFPYFDLIKLDCEGSEFSILENWPAKWAMQVNIEFHDNLFSPDGKGLPQSYFDRLFAEKLPDYRVIQNEPDSLGIHADALLVLASPSSPPEPS